MLRQTAMFEKSGAPDTYSTVPKARETWMAKSMLRTQPPAGVKRPDSESSIGRHRSSLGKLNFWDITGPATSLIPLKKEVKILFDKHVDHLKPDPKKDCSPTILFDLFMTGCTEDTACPTLVIICADKSSRGKAIKLVRDSNLLEKPEYSPVLLGQCSKNPRYLNAQLPQEITKGSALDPGNARINEYFLPKDGIDREVITGDICRYLGNDARVRPGDYDVYYSSIDAYISYLSNI
jgi:hypothetical protein